MGKRRLKRFLTVLLLLGMGISIVCGVYVVAKSVQFLTIQKPKTIKTETVDPSDHVYIVADYDRKIFGPYRFGRGNNRDQYIYRQLGSRDDTETVLVGGGTIEKYMHDGDRYIAFHYTERVGTAQADGETRYEKGDQYYGVLDTQTNAVERFTDIEALSKAIQERHWQFGNWFYTAGGNSVEGIRTPLLKDYAYEYLDEFHGQAILLREIPMFYGMLQNIRTDGERYIAFRQQVLRNDSIIWYADPITNSLNSIQWDKTVGLYRRSALIYFWICYDQYVLWDTDENQIAEFDTETALTEYCQARSVAFHAAVDWM